MLNVSEFFVIFFIERSFGCILYELITLEKAIEGSTLIRIKSQINSFSLEFSLEKLKLSKDISLDANLEFTIKKYIPLNYFHFLMYNQFFIKAHC